MDKLVKGIAALAVGGVVVKTIKNYRLRKLEKELCENEENQALDA